MALKIVLELEKGEEPYIETKVIDEDLGYGIEKGLMVDTKIYLPKDFSSIMEYSENKN